MGASGPIRDQHTSMVDNADCLPDGAERLNPERLAAIGKSAARLNGTVFDLPEDEPIDCYALVWRVF